MPAPRFLTLAGSVREGSHNGRLAEHMARRLEAAGAEVTRLSLGDHPLPLYSAALEAQGGVPDEARALHALFRAQAGIFIASPEYNASVPPLLVNALSWISRVREDGGIAAAFGRPVFAIGAASPGALGGYRGLIALRHLLELGLGARVLPAMVSVPGAVEAFDEAGDLRAERARAMAETVTARLVEAAG